MNHKERVIAAVNHKEVFPVPYSISFTSEEAEKVGEYLKDADFRSKIGNHIDSVGLIPEVTTVKPGYVKDAFGVVWNRTIDKDIGVVDQYLIPEPEKKYIRLSQPDLDFVDESIKRLLVMPGENFLIVDIGCSMFERAWTLCGMENLLMWMVTDGNFVHALLDAICDYNMEIIQRALQYPIDCFMFGDDWGQQKGQIMGPTYWREYILPRVKRMYKAVKDAGKFVCQHSCGDIQALFPDLIDAGLDIYQTFQPEIYDMAKVKEEYGSSLTFWGGISTQHFLPFAAPEEIKVKVNETIALLGKRGGYIVAPTHSMPKDIPVQNV
ncbi:MAG TPA: uroporphyrinogen decarboxylase, partial [Clostridiales bacterium]|nr:uroporphyrinogen decarboxylase [Clostridiales bacterium]